jgi:hypothetical protein
MAKRNPAFEELVAMDATRLARELEDAHRQLLPCACRSRRAS